MNLNDYFDPVEIRNTQKNYINSNVQLLSAISVHTEKAPIDNIEDFDLVFIGLPNCKNDEFVDEFSEIRNELYSLTANKKIKFYDLGNLKCGQTKNDSIIGLRDVIIELVSKNIIPIIIGNSEDIIYSQYLALKQFRKKINIVSVDSKISALTNKETGNKTTLWKILVDESEALFSFTNIGYQTYFVNHKTLQFLTENYHLAYRTGYVRSNIKEVEPVFRDAEIIGINISAIRQSDAPAQINASPNGFYGEEICQISRYAGVSNNISVFGVYDYAPDLDFNNQTSRMISQMIWYFIDGYYQRINENPMDKTGSYKKFLVNLNSFEYELIFYKSEKTDRWWMEIPNLKSENKSNLIISCTLEDYQKAGNGEVPERWIKTFQKINSN